MKALVLVAAVVLLAGVVSPTEAGQGDSNELIRELDREQRESDREYERRQQERREERREEERRWEREDRARVEERDRQEILNQLRELNRRTR